MKTKSSKRPKLEARARRPLRQPATRQRLAPAERRAQIIGATKKLFATGGIEMVSMRSIAREVGVTQAAIYQHFEDKEAILTAIAEDFFAELIVACERVAAEESDPITRLARSMRGYVEVGLARADEYRLVFMTNIPGFRHHGLHRLPEGEEPPEEMTKGKIAYSFLQEQVRQLLANGDIRGGEPETVAEAIWAAGHGLVSLMITHVDFPWAREALVETQLRILLNGLLPEGSPRRR